MFWIGVCDMNNRLIFMFGRGFVALYAKRKHVISDRTSSEEELLALIRLKDDLVFDHIFNQFYRPLCFFAKKLVQDGYDAEDIIQDVFVKFWRRDNDFDSLSAMRAFLYVSARNACLNFIEKNHVKIKHQQYLVGQEQLEEVTILQTLVEAEVLRQVFDAVDKLPEQCRKVITMTFVEGLKPKEIAEELGVTVSTVNNQKMRGLNLLRNQLPDDSIYLAILLFMPGLIEMFL